MAEMNKLYPQLADRTGYAYWIFQCDPNNEYDKTGKSIEKGSKNHWMEYDNYETHDSFGRGFPVSEYKKEIVASYGQAIYEEALKSGKTLTYEEGTRHKIFSKDERVGRSSVNCTPREQIYAYDNLDFDLTMTFEYEPETPPDIPPPVKGEACVPYEKVIAGGGESLGATRTWEKVECKEVDGATDGLTEGDIAMWMYKPSSESITQLKVKNDLRRSPKRKHFAEKEELEKWTTTGTGIEPRVKTAPSTYTGVGADPLKGRPVELSDRYLDPTQLRHYSNN